MKKLIFTIILTLIFISTFQPHFIYPPTKIVENRLIYNGIASFYADRFEGRFMANGQRFRQTKLTAAVPITERNRIGQYVQVCNDDTCIVVQITDVGELHGRVIDLSKSAFIHFDTLSSGLTQIHVLTNH